MTNIETTEQIGVIALLDEKSALVGVIYKDPVSRKNVVYRTDEMSFEEMQSIFKKEKNI